MLSTADPIFNAPVLNFLEPHFGWTEREPDDARIDVVVVVARALPTNHRAVVRGEIVASPAYTVACNDGSRMVGRAELGATLVEWAQGGHEVKVERREVRCGLLDIVALSDDQIEAGGDEGSR